MKVDQNDNGNASALHLLHRAGQCADELFAANVGQTDLTPRQFAVLKAVASSDEPSQTTLVEMTGIDRSTLADIVRRLVDKGQLQRKRTRRDARMYAVRLTERGHESLQKAEPAAQATDDRLLAVLPQREREAFIDALNRIIETVAPAETPDDSARSLGRD